jgi:hypothetical protein
MEFMKVINWVTNIYKHRIFSLLFLKLGDRQLIVWNKADIYAKEFYKVIPSSISDVVSLVAQLNSTLGILQRKLFVLTALGD